MSPEPIQAESHGEGFPRVSGDEPGGDEHVHGSPGVFPA